MSVRVKRNPSKPSVVDLNLGLEIQFWNQLTGWEIVTSKVVVTPYDRYLKVSAVTLQGEILPVRAYDDFILRLNKHPTSGDIIEVPFNGRYPQIERLDDTIFIYFNTDDGEGEIVLYHNVDKNVYILLSSTILLWA